MSHQIIIYSLNNKSMINPQKSKTTNHSKLLTRFNNYSISRMSTQQHQNHLSQKLFDKPINLNKNQLIFLKCQIDQQNTMIEKLVTDLQACNSAQNLLNQTIDKLKNQNKNVMETLEEQIKQNIQLENNQKMLKNTNEQLTDAFTEGLENPEDESKKKKNEIGTSTDHKQPLMIQSQSNTQSNINIKLYPQLYQITIKQKPQNIEQMIKKQQEQHTQKQMISKLEQAIYYLKKQLNEKQQLYNKKIIQLTNQHRIQIQKLSKICQRQIITNINNQQKKIIQKNSQLIHIQHNFSKQLKQMQGVANKMNEQFQTIISNKQQQINKMSTQIQNNKQTIKQLQIHNAQLNQNIKMIQIKLQDKSQQLIRNQKQQNNLIFINSQFKNKHKETVNFKQHLIRQRTDKIIPIDKKKKSKCTKFETNEENQQNHQLQLSNNNNKINQLPQQIPVNNQDQLQTEIVNKEEKNQLQTQSNKSPQPVEIQQKQSVQVKSNIEKLQQEKMNQHILEEPNQQNIQEIIQVSQLPKNCS